MSKNETVEEFDRLVRRDPAGRGLIGTEQQRGALCPGHLAAAAVELADSAGRVVIVTGFFIPHGEPPAAETDGPPGAVTLGRVLADLGHDVVLVTDEPCAGATRAAVLEAGLPGSCVEEAPLQGTADWCENFLQRAAGSPLSHLVAIERVGPSHDPVSLQRQAREGSAPVELFEERVPRSSWGCCHNMRGEVIDEWTADISPLFDRLTEFSPEATSIGIGDGGNEIGMGSVPWEELVARLPGEHSLRIPCRIATDWTLVAGISNWGAWALSAAVAVCAGRPDVIEPLTGAWQRGLVERMVADGPAVDGPSGKAMVGVDGLPIEDYLHVWQEIREMLGWSS